jgi:hypothetical protein
MFFRLGLPVYPEARQISEVYGFYGANTGVQNIYYWTSDSVDEIQQYYERFTYPFIEEVNNPSIYRTVFNPSGALLPVVTNEFSRETLDLGQGRFCYYRLHGQCVMVQIIDFGDKESIVLEDLGTLIRGNQTPEPADLKGGRLIVYTYYIGDFS